MCLAIPMTIIEINGDLAMTESSGVRTEVNIALTPGVVCGDKVLIHAGFAIEKLDPAAAEEIENLWAELADKNQQEGSQWNR